MLVGVVGKPNVGKTTFFDALTLAGAEIANYPFTTVEPNKGVGYIRRPCPCQEFKVTCTPNNSICRNGTRYVPVTLLDVAGLVPGAHQGRGLGNQFLDDLRRADLLIHVVDGAGATDSEGNPSDPGSHDPTDDISWLEQELDLWLAGILEKDWMRLAKRAESGTAPLMVLLLDRLSGLGVSEAVIAATLRETALSVDKPTHWSDEEMKAFASVLRKLHMPILIAANKGDLAPAELMDQLVEREEGDTTRTCADYERSLRLAGQAGLVDYEPGAEAFELTEAAKEKLNAAQKGALEKIAGYLEEHGSTGVQSLLERAVLKDLDQIAVYPVEDETHLTDKQERVLPDVYLVPRGTTARELAFKVHTDLGERFIRAVDCRTKRVVGADHVLEDGDVVKVVAART